MDRRCGAIWFMLALGCAGLIDGAGGERVHAEAAGSPVIPAAGNVTIIVTGGELDEQTLDVVRTTANAVIDAAELWLGFRLFPAVNHTPEIRIDAARCDPVLARYRFDERCVELSRSIHRDVVAHEYGHAIVHRLKPGWNSGASLIIHEGIADMFAVLTALLDDDTLARVLVATDGDIRLPNEASEIVETLADGPLRSAVRTGGLEGIGISRDAVHISLIPGAHDDPHFAGEVLASALYETICLIADSRTMAGFSRFDAVRSAAHDVGRLMIGALFACGENRTTLQEYSLAVVSLAGLVPDLRLASVAISESFERRGLIATGCRRPGACGRDPEAFLPEILLRLDADPRSVSVVDVFRDPPFFPPGSRFIRVRYSYNLPSPTPESYASAMSLQSGGEETERRTIPAYAGFLFDGHGRLISAYVDPPIWPAGPGFTHCAVSGDPWQPPR